MTLADERTGKWAQKRWNIQAQISRIAEQELEAYPPILRQILFNRGQATREQANTYLNAEPGFDTSPWGIKGMEATVDRILFSLDRGEQIAIYGDYDVDGVTATALLVQTLRSLGGNVIPYIPNRFDEGYGLNPEALDSLKAEGVQLVITVDCGIRSPAEADHARSIGLDLIVTDHHQPADALPRALAVINPKQAGDNYPEKNLAGVGLAYKLAQALFERSPKSLVDPRFGPADLLDLVALGTVADLAPLTGENRQLVRMGLIKIRATRRQGLFALANVAGHSLPQTSASHIGFILGPRLNAAGRLDSALAAYNLLTTADVFEAGTLAQQLDVQNVERQKLMREIQKKAEEIALAEGEENAHLLFAVHPEFNSGVVGLAASRLSESYYRPAIVGQQTEEFTRCSCRSIPEFHITQALDRCADLLVRHGGHAAAAGFTVENRNLPELVDRLKQLAKDELQGQDLRPTLTADMEVPLTEMRPDLLKVLQNIEPTGYGNPDALFISKDVKVKFYRAVGRDGAHLKLTLEDERGYTHDAIAFRQGELAPFLDGQRIDLLYTFETNEFNGRVNLQLNVRDIRLSGMED